MSTLWLTIATAPQKTVVWSRSLLARDEGQAMGEYSVILALVAVVVVAALTYLGYTIFAKTNTVAPAFGGTGAPAP
jgi:pilus assembly protein Flp/PilA